MDNFFKKKQMQFGEKRTDKHFEKQQNAVWRKINGQTFQKIDKSSFRKRQTDKHFKRKAKCNKKKEIIVISQMRMKKMTVTVKY